MEQDYKELEAGERGGAGRQKAPPPRSPSLSHVYTMLTQSRTRSHAVLNMRPVPVLSLFNVHPPSSRATLLSPSRLLVGYLVTMRR